MEQGFQAFSKETVLSVFMLSSVKEEIFVKFVFALQCCALVSGRGQNMDPWSMDPLFGPGPWTPYFFIFLFFIFHFLFAFFFTIFLFFFIKK